MGREAWTENGAMDLRLCWHKFPEERGGGGRAGNSICEGTEAGQQAPRAL